MQTLDLKKPAAPAPEPAAEPIDPNAPAAEAEAPPELAEEAQAGESAAGKAANAALRSLSRAARAFTLYDPANAAIHRFLEDFRDRTQQAIQAAGELVLDVRPFELVLGQETVYLERDRERSLAFRLFRDGVRQLSIGPGVRWEELLRLLELLSVRFVGVRQQEDDLVTLLDKAAFENIRYVAVEGFVARDDEEDPQGSEFALGVRPTSLPRAQVPPDFDLPLPAPAQPKAFGMRPVPAAYLAQLQAEESAETIPASSLRLVRELIAAAADKARQVSFEDAARVATEVRDFFVADRRLGALVELVNLVRKIPAPANAPFARLIEGLGSPEALGKLLDGIDLEVEAPPPELLTILSLVPGEHLRHLAVRFGQLEEDGPRRRLLRALIASRARTEPDALRAAVSSSEGAVAVDLFALLCQTTPDRALPAAVALADHADVQVQCAVLGTLAGAPSTHEDAVRIVLQKLESKELSVRLAATRAMGAMRSMRGYDVLSKEAQRRAASLSTEEASAIGEALARISAESARTLLTSWVSAKASLLKRMAETPATRMLRFVAVAGLGLCPGPEPEKLIRELAAQSDDEELKQHCVATMVRRRKEGGHARG